MCMLRLFCLSLLLSSCALAQGLVDHPMVPVPPRPIGPVLTPAQTTLRDSSRAVLLRFAHHTQALGTLPTDTAQTKARSAALLGLFARPDVLLPKNGKIEISGRAEASYRIQRDRKSTRLNSSHSTLSRMPSSA